MGLTRRNKTIIKFPSDIDFIKASLERARNAILSPCLNFSLEPVGPFFPPTRITKNYSLHFSTTSPYGLQIKANRPAPGVGLHIYKDLNIVIVPPCKKVEIEFSNFANLTWQILDPTGVPIQSIPPSPAPSKTKSSSFTATGDIEVIRFKSNNESDLRKICLK